MEDHRDRAVAATARWAKRFRLRPWRLPELVTGVDSIGSTYARAITRFTRKTPLWRQRPHEGRKRPSDPSTTPEQVDPWTVDEANLKEDSWHVLACPTCDGAKKVDCGACHGSARVTCVECGGGGQVPSKSAKNHRMVTCRKCRGGGTMKCPTCRNGRVDCYVCSAKGKLEAWIEIDVKQRNHVGVWPSGVHERTHPELTLDTYAADQWPGAVVVETAEASHQLGDGNVGPKAQALKWSAARTLVEPSLDARLDRVTYQGVRVYEAPVTSVKFAFSGKQGELQLLGTNVEPTSEFDESPFESYRKWLLGAVALAGIDALALTGLYSGRDPFFVATGGQVLLALLVAGLGALLYIASWRRRLRPAGNKLRRGLVEWAGIGLLVAGFSAAGLAYARVHPSLDAANDAIEDGDLAEARRHLEALDRLGLNDEESDTAWIATYQAKVHGLRDDARILAMLPAPNERFGKDERIARLRRQARLRLIGSALDELSTLAAGQQIEGLQVEHGGDNETVLAEVRGLIVAKATALIEQGKPGDAERILSIGWDTWGAEPEYLALGERAVLAVAGGEENVVDKVEVLRRAEKLDASDVPEQRLGAVYATLEARLSEPLPDDASEQALTDRRNALELTQRLFPEHKDDLDVHLKPVDAELARIADERAKEAAERLRVEERKRKAAERKAQRERRAAERKAAQARSSTSSSSSRTCCKYCSKGKPCGDSCIARNKTCHKGRGCAC